MKQALVGFVLVVGVLVVGLISAAPKLTSQQECMYFADLAMMSRSAAIEGVPHATTVQVIRRAYQITTTRHADLAALVIASAYRSAEEPLPFAQKFLETCIRQSGDVDSLIGTAS